MLKTTDQLVYFQQYTKLLDIIMQNQIISHIEILISLWIHEMLQCPTSFSVT